jgi:hypothetical protein
MAVHHSRTEKPWGGIKWLSLSQCKYLPFWSVGEKISKKLIRSLNSAKETLSIDGGVAGINTGNIL